MRVKVTEYRGYVIIETQPGWEKDKKFVPCGNGNIGCVMLDLTKKSLGMSREAFEALKRLQRVPDDLGDVDSWLGRGKPCFAWIGPLTRIAAPDAVTSRDSDFDLLKFTEIPNEAPDGAKAEIDQKEGEG